MPSRFRVLSEDELMDFIPGPIPTLAEEKNFKGADFSSVKTQADLRSQVVCNVRENVHDLLITGTR